MSQAEAIVLWYHRTMVLSMVGSKDTNNCVREDPTRGLIAVQKIVAVV